MIILLTFFVLLIIGIILVNTEKGNTSGVVLTATAGVFLAIGLMALPLSRYSVNTQIQEYKATVITVEKSRKDRIENRNIELENAALLQKIIESNAWLASIQYQNESVLDIYIPDEVMKLKPIE